MVIYDGNGNAIAVETDVETDTTLTQGGVPADALATGEKISEITGVNLIEPSDIDIPIVFFSGRLPTSKAEGELPQTIEYVSRTLHFKEYCTLKVQGDSSASYPKKNFNMKLFSDSERTVKSKRNFRGWGRTNKFCLKANWIDHTHARNVVNAKLYGQMCKSRSDYGSYPASFRESPNCACIDGFPIKVYSNGIYQGLYTWNIAKDKFMSNMDDSEGSTCSMLVGDSTVANGVLFQSTSLIDGTDWTDELNDDVPAWVHTSWQNAQNFVMNSSNADFKANVENYFYLSSLIDRYIFSLVFEYVGGFAKSQAYYTYDGVKWLSSMYDLDTTWALHWNGTSFLSTSYACPEDYEAYNLGKSNALIDRIMLLYKPEIKARYADLRADVLSTGNIIATFEHFMDTMQPLYAEDYASTTANGAFTQIPLATTNNIQKLRQMIVERLAYSDNLINSL